MSISPLSLENLTLGSPSSLQQLKQATTIQDVADLLGFQPKSIAYILYKKPPQTRYTQFVIPKRTGGLRTISAPYAPLRALQGKLGDLLALCEEELVLRSRRGSLSHAFKRDHSILTNAIAHRNRRYVLNLDLKDFFAAINFGRVRGFFIKNRDYALNPKVATILAQIVCHENGLPQGSPCSPIVSNLVGHVLDVHLARLARDTRSTYSRYADDITFSTNERTFPSDVAVPDANDPHKWKLGRALLEVIAHCGFEVNPQKTRMQYHDSRQVVTGLTVNRRVNSKREYRLRVRNMVHHLVNLGAFYFPSEKRAGAPPGTPNRMAGSPAQLGGMLSFIDSVDVVYDRSRPKPPKDLSARSKVYRTFVFYRDFFCAERPVILSEGKTDVIYLKGAIRQLGTGYPELIDLTAKGGGKLKVRLFENSRMSARLLHLSGGAGGLANFIRSYVSEASKFRAPGNTNPVVIVIDSDSGADKVFAAVREKSKDKFDEAAQFHFVPPNLYVVPLPRGADGRPASIEDFFDASIFKKKFGDKVFNPSNKGVAHNGQFGKAWFAEKIVLQNLDAIDFTKFKVILDRISAALGHHKRTRTKAPQPSR